jgi:hypothetical protein
MEPRPRQFANRKEVIMSPIELLKSEAVALQAKEKALGRLMKHCDALEQVARNHGYENWRACRAVLAATSAAAETPPANATPTGAAGMRRYENSDWNFALDIPTRWNSFPTVPSNSPYEVIRFASREDGNHLVIIFRKPHDPKKSLKEVSDQVQRVLAASGFGNFTTTETTIKSRAALMLEFDKPQGEGTWSCREYFVAEGTLGYTLGFGTDNKAGMFELYDRMAKSFEILPLPPAPLPGS